MLHKKKATTTMNEINWNEELLDSAKFNNKQENLLKNGAKSLTDSWFLGVLYTRWKKLKGIREQTPPECNSSFKEWNKKIDDADQCQS